MLRTRTTKLLEAFRHRKDFWKDNGDWNGGHLFGGEEAQIEVLDEHYSRKALEYGP